ncbi:MULTISPECIES: type II toxin-antitoxin system RatA family toxin [Pseudoalteromonas]|uniref:Cyclase n=1 Tax=Pseudoalteromonas ruthenica TaxID=151081 RepID=A0A0F4Q3I9_9GAMM|nr:MULTISPECIES: type II toxin-antitoxin system RatA family toxin [Pseudoalteromonas]KJZ00835.1 cyclase [Pseudoalteromonas ruthenica]KJZ01112.1 cyclase [Pseudoalteromonas ruthenica]MCF2863121.1 type II toxin-antitoxin system RatA family toxin [Pseudoalteromonas sp. CNAT2-18]MCG7559273.1 type II toxin-antitoxin system RatA family toxin [Pseudoalteromonas sp. CNAT2-18.1]MCG7566908.1 type II toxin-antitoxin system RatA family toxin [Pseudoalteromonas sp. CnMc7-15]|tara:strand:+ start:6516 stop:6959 length:444 start_codon:yes stop_codon:yes gene_type:complete
MPQIEKSALVMYSSQEMFDLVNDVDAYPQFLPHCSDSKVFAQGDNTMRAGLEISKAGLKKWFTTENKLDEQAYTIALQLVDGPFKHLHGHWHFKPLDEHACKVSLKLEFEFASKLVEMAFGRIFNDVAKNMVKAFTQRAKVVYGERA